MIQNLCANCEYMFDSKFGSRKCKIYGYALDTWCKDFIPRVKPWHERHE